MEEPLFQQAKRRINTAESNALLYNDNGGSGQKRSMDAAHNRTGMLVSPTIQANGIKRGGYVSAPRV